MLAQWVKLPKQAGVLATDYGYAIGAVLILNGPFVGKSGDSRVIVAYYEPFSGFERFHDESALMAWSSTHSPQEYSFFAGYENWLDGRLKLAGLLTG